MTTHLWASPPFTHANDTDPSGLAQSLLDTPSWTYSGVGGALRAPLGPVVAPLVPRCALLPAPTPRLRTRFARGGGLGSQPNVVGDTRWDDGCGTHDRQMCGMHDCPMAQNVGWCASPWQTREARPHAGGGGGKECAARNERSNDWPQGGRRLPLTRTSR